MDLVLDRITAELKISSTVVDLTGEELKLLRKGFLDAKEAFEALKGIVPPISSIPLR